MLSSFFRKGGVSPDSGDTPGLTSVGGYLQQMNRAEDRKQTDANAFLLDLEERPWPTLMAEWLVSQEGPLPALVLCNAAGDAQLDVSGVFHPPHHYYQFSFRGPVKHAVFFRKTLQASFEVHSKQDARGIVQCFARGDYDALRAEMARVGQNVLSLSDAAARAPRHYTPTCRPWGARRRRLR